MAAVEREGSTIPLSWQDFEIFRAFSFKNTFQQLYRAKIRRCCTIDSLKMKVLKSIENLVTAKNNKTIELRQMLTR